MADPVDTPRLIAADRLSVQDATRRALEQSRILGALRGRDGGGTSGDVTDDWKASVDRQLGQLHGDVRALLTRGVAAVVALALMIGGLYLRTDMKFDKAGDDLRQVETRIDDRLRQVEVHQQRIDDKLDLLLERSASGKKSR